MFQDSLLAERHIDEQMNFRLSLNKVKNKKIDQQMSASARKQQKIRDIDHLNRIFRTDREVYIYLYRFFGKLLDPVKIK